MRTDLPLRAARLPWLLEITGLEGRRELLRQLVSDLSRAHRDLREGLADHDRERLTAAVHVLVSLAGTLGDGALTARVQALQRRLREGESPVETAGDMRDLDCALDGLRAEIEAARGAETPSDGGEDAPR